MTNKMTSFLLTEIALDLLGNHFYTVDGQHVRDLQTLYKFGMTEPPTGEKDLMSVLCISETSLRAADNIADEIISLDDDEEEMKDVKPNFDLKTQIDSSMIPAAQNAPSIETFSISTSNNQIVITKQENNAESMSGATGNTKQQQEPVKVTSVKSNEKESVDKELGVLASKSKNEKMKRQTCSVEYNYKSEDINERLSYIIKSASEEYGRMKFYANKLKKNFLEDNKALIALRSLKQEDFLKRFYLQQKISLTEESNSLMQFIKIIKNEESHPKEIINRVASDILQAKDLIS